MHRLCLENILYVQKRNENNALNFQNNTADYKNNTADFVNSTADYKNNSADLRFMHTVLKSSLHRYFLFVGKFNFLNLSKIKISAHCFTEESVKDNFDKDKEGLC